MNAFDQAIRRLTNLYGIQTSYVDVFKKRHAVSKSTLLLFLNTLGIATDDPKRVIERADFETSKRWDLLVEPITLTWNQRLQVKLRLPNYLAKETVECQLVEENGAEHCWLQRLDVLNSIQKHAVDGNIYLTKSLVFDRAIPWGYHRLNLTLKENIFSTFIISAPKFSYAESNNNDRHFGIFSPLYALNSTRNFGSGDFTDWLSLIEWLKSLDGDIAGTLPLFSSFLDQSFEPSPYSPISRLFFNEFYLDVTKIPEFNDNKKAKSLFLSPLFQQQLSKLRKLNWVDYAETMACKRKILEILSQDFFKKPSGSRHKIFHEFIKANPEIESYADFRALGEIDNSSTIKNYYLYSQWQTEQQLSEVSNFAHSNQVKLYLDMPLGVHPQGYDVWKNPQLFARNLSVGAPPDAVFTRGQNWGFPPLIPQVLRAEAYQYFINVFQKLFKYVDLLRIDHVMGLHRLYCIPSGNEAKDGAFLKYPAEELYAILCVESNRNKTCLIGENLGTVPKYINKTMKKHRLHQMYVLQYEMDANSPISADVVPHDSISSLNTHDMPTFAAYCRGLDLKFREESHLITKMQAKVEAARRKKSLNQLPVENKRTLKSLLSACLNLLASSRSRFLLINLEDLWLETEPQNVPVSGEGYPNWQKKMGKTLKEIRQDKHICAILKKVARLCQGKKAKKT